MRKTTASPGTKFTLEYEGTLYNSIYYTSQRGRERWVEVSGKSCKAGAAGDEWWARQLLRELIKDGQYK